MNGALVNYDTGRRALQLARSHDEVADIRDKAQALTQYARQAKDTELLAWVSEIKVRAERRAGELIIEQQLNGTLAKPGDNQHTRSSQPATTTLANEGITKSDSSRWQKIASLDEEQFESAVAIAKDHIGEVTTAFVLRQAKAAKPKSNGAAKKAQRVRVKKEPIPLWKQQTPDGRLHRFYIVVNGCREILKFEMTPEEWLAESSADSRHLIKPAVEPARQWLSRLLEICP